MAKIPFYQVDTFTTQLFSGNPAAVCLIDAELPDKLLQAIAMENNLSETAFVFKNNNDTHIRWFTPSAEVDLCGHATLAAAYVLMHFVDKHSQKITFKSKKYCLNVECHDDLFTLNLPATPGKLCKPPSLLISAINKPIHDFLRSNDYLVVLKNEADIKSLQPDMAALCKLDKGGVIVTAQGNDCDFVSRFFVPKISIPEDPVTGSAHCTLAPYWSKQLKKNKLYAKQLSKRGGELFCEMKGNCVLVSGHAILYAKGHLEI